MAALIAYSSPEHLELLRRITICPAGHELVDGWCRACDWYAELPHMRFPKEPEWDGPEEAN